MARNGKHGQQRNRKVATSACRARAAELAQIAKRCGAKAKVFRFRARHQSYGADEALASAEATHEYQELIAEVKLLERCDPHLIDACFDFDAAADPLETLADCFYTLAVTIDVANSINRLPCCGKLVKESGLCLLAEAQATLRSAVRAVRPDFEDDDQLRVFDWLRFVAGAEQIRIPCFMRASDVGDPKQLPKLAERVEELRQHARQKSEPHRKGRHARPRPGRGQPHVATPARLTPEVAQLANKLEGKEIVIIGGACPDCHTERRLKDAFRVKRIFWPQIRGHKSVKKIKHLVAREDVALILMLTRCSSHLFGLKKMADRCGKPLVLMPAGWNANQVAAVVMSQASRLLGGA